MRLTSSDWGVTSAPSRNTRVDCELPPWPPAPLTLRLELEMDEAPKARDRDAFTSRFVLRDDVAVVVVTLALLGVTLTDDGELIVASKC